MSVKAALEKRASSLSGSYEKYSNSSFLVENKNELREIRLDDTRLLALKGLQYLASVDGDVWNKYLKDNLFTELPKPRELSTTEGNNELSTRLRKLLFRLSKFFLLKESHYIFEYLVRCYGVHLYESEALLKCILPYHESVLFIRMAKLISYTKLRLFSFLEDIVNNSQSTVLSKGKLVKEIIKSKPVLEFIVHIPLSYAKTRTNYSHIHTFYSSLIIQLLSTRDVQKISLETILKYTLSGLDTHDSEMQISSYIILASLLSRMNLTQEMYSKIEKAIVQHSLPHLHYHSLLTLVYDQE